MWDRAPAWGRTAGSDFLTNSRAVPSDPALGRPDTSDPYSAGQFTPVIAPVPTAPDVDQIRTDAYVAPYTGPLDLDDYGRETDEMRRAYRDLHRKEPAVRSAVDGKAASVAALDLIVKPRDKTKPLDVAAAAFVKEQIEQSEHGPDGLILNMLRAAFIDGWSVLEKTFRTVPGPTGPRWGLLHCKSRDTAHLRLRLDGYRNVLGVVNTVRGIRTHDPRKVILFTHADLFSNPYGQSDLRAAYRSANLINDAYQLWHVAVKVFSGPFLKGKVKEATRRKQMEAALRAARAAGTIVTPEEDDVEILNMASATSFDAFEKKVRIHREEIYLAVRHAYMPFMQSSSGGSDQRGDTNVNKGAGSDPLEFLIAKAVGRVLSHQLVPDLVLPNFPAGTGMPIVQLGGTSWGETKAQLDVAAMLKDKWGLDVSAEYLLDVTQMPPPKGPDDTPPGPNGGGGPSAPAAPASGALGAPGAPANPAAPTSTAPGGPAPTPAVSAPSAAPASTFAATEAPKYARYFAPSRHGHYPGDLHEQFGLGVAQFAGATGLLRRQVRRAGAADWVWAAPPAVPPQPPPQPPPPLVQFAMGAPVPVPLAHLHADPQRLQWRAGAAADGTVRPLPPERYDPSKAGTLLAWRDPASGRALVLEGHHRLAHARRDGAQSAPVRFVDAPDADAAREIGRRANERGAAFASEHADGEEWESNGRRYKRVGGETVRLPSATGQGGIAPGVPPTAVPVTPAPAGDLDQKYVAQMDKAEAQASGTQRAKAESLVGHWRHHTANGRAAEANEAARRMLAHGAERLHAAGETVPFDGRTMEAQVGVSDGSPVKVTRHGWGMPGDALPLVQAQVEPVASEKRFALDVLGDAPEAITEEEFLRLIESGEWVERAAGEGETFAQCGPGTAPKMITVHMKSGKSYDKTVCVKTDEAKKEAWAKNEVAKADAAKAKKEEANRAQEQRIDTTVTALTNPETADPAAFADAVARLTVSEMQSIKRQLGVKGGKLKGELQQKLVERFKARLAEEQARRATGPAFGGPAVGTLGGKPSAHAQVTGVDVYNRPVVQVSPQYERDHPYATKQALGDPDAGTGPNPNLPDHTRPPVADLDTAKYLNNYTWGYDGDMNEALRETGAPPPGPFGANGSGKPDRDGPAMHAALQRQFAAAKPFDPPPITVYRGLGFTTPAVRANLEAAARAALQSGGLVTMPGYVSTATKGGAQFPGKVQFEIKARHGLDLKGYSHFPDESELLLNHNCGYKVTAVNTDAAGNLKIALEQVTTGGTSAPLKLDGK